MNYIANTVREQSGDQVVWMVSVTDISKDPHRVAATFPCYSEQQASLVSDIALELVIYVLNNS